MRTIFLGMIICCVWACGNDGEEQAETDKQVILDYLTSNNLTATETESGLFYIILDEGRGNGNRPNENSKVHVNYKGYLTNGNVFDSTDAQGAIFRLGNLIAAWREGIPKIKEGGQVMLLSPSKLAYGSTARPGIPKNSVLIFEITLRAVIE